MRSACSSKATRRPRLPASEAQKRPAAPAPRIRTSKERGRRTSRCVKASLRQSEGGRKLTERRQRQGLVEGGGEFGVAKMVEEVGDLRGRDASEGERGKIVFGEKLGAGGFVAVSRGASD